MRWLRVIVGLTVLAVLLCGCVQTTAGTARTGADPIRSTTDTPDSRLAQFLLTPDEVHVVMGSDDIELVDSNDDMSDNSADISDPSCLGALYIAEATVYRGTGWTDVLDQVFAEPEDDSNHWLEQTVVALPSRQHVLDFFNRSVRNWTNCIGKQVTVDDGENQFDWRFEGIGISDNRMNQTAQQANGGEWACQHVLAAVRNYIVETAACGNSLKGQAVQLANRIVANIK